MRTTTTTAALALVATTALIGLGTVTATALAPAGTAAPRTVKEKGIVLECTGSAHGLDGYVNVYENDPYGNYFQVILDGDPELARSREPADIWSEGRIRASVRIDGGRALVFGTARKVGRATKVHEEYDDAGQHIVADGIHRRLRNALVLRYDDTRVRLTCDPAFFYNLDVTKTDSTGD
jgi:hypothetical protein